jgi:hypothetical protein
MARVDRVLEDFEVRAVLAAAPSFVTDALYYQECGGLHKR